MPTLNQIRKNQRFRKRKNKKKGLPAMEKGPQRLGTCMKIYTTSPKKPNSANRKVAKVRLNTGHIIIGYIPGEAHTLQEHATVLIQGGRTQDLPGVRYKLMRGLKDLKGVKGRQQGRSKYGTKKVNFSELLN